MDRAIRFVYWFFFLYFLACAGVVGGVLFMSEPGMARVLVGVYAFKGMVCALLMGFLVWARPHALNRAERMLAGVVLLIVAMAASMFASGAISVY